MNLKNRILLILILSLMHSAYAFDMKEIVAYPVPFNPNTKKLNVGYAGSVSTTSCTVNVSVFDINGDVVLKKAGSQLPFIWNGRNSSGRIVKPGLYILKVEIENDTGDYGKKIIRILVDY